MTGQRPTVADIPVCAGPDCGARSPLVWDSRRRCWWCPKCTLADHGALVADKNAEASWPPGPAGRDFGPGSVVPVDLIAPDGLLSRMLDDGRSSPG